MGCALVKGEGFSAIVCGRGRGIKPCVGCGRLASRQCDFKMVRSGVAPSGQPWIRKGTCSAYICASCTTALPGEKDACPEHAAVCLEACRRAGIQLPLAIA